MVWLKSLFIVLLSVSAEAATSDNEIGYETIVSELSRTRTTRPSTFNSQNSLIGAQTIHTGVAYVQSFLSVRSTDGSTLQGLTQGVQASFGIDLFSRNWFAEGAIRSFGNEDIKTANVQLREFDLKIMYRSEPRSLLGYRLGLGLAARDMKITEDGVERKFSTPSTVVVAGVDTNISKNLTVGGEASFRSAMIADSDDRQAFDFGIRLDARF